ncbi:hypothetical protein B7494_g3516 [Chlorociboria aeruginascens]|nr:hypothetical protein B7494_g3516 [Chlorociboria aeruginascens]
MASSATTETITTACACRKFNLTVQFPTSSLPVNRALCLCNGCRRLSGSCSNSYIALPSSVSSALDLSSFSLSSYKSSEDLERYFCSTCGAHVLFRRITAGFWALSTGLWDSTEDVIRWTGCKWVEDTLDGGISVWLSSITDKDGSKRELKRWKLNDVGGELMPEGSLIIPPRAKEKDEKLTAQCRCGGVKFYVTRPNEESKTVHSPFPDLMIPYHTGASSANPQNETWFLRNNATRYLAGTCF